MTDEVNTIEIISEEVMESDSSKYGPGLVKCKRIGPCPAYFARELEAAYLRPFSAEEAKEMWDKHPDCVWDSIQSRPVHGDTLETTIFDELRFLRRQFNLLSIDRFLGRPNYRYLVRQYENGGSGPLENQGLVTPRRQDTQGR